MASKVETTAVALRKGDTPSNLKFTGVLGELVMDAGYEEGGILGLDSNTTIRIHNGITPGGIPLCRADTKNITTQSLAENRTILGDKNLAYADLSNIATTMDIDSITRIVDTLKTYGMATTDEVEFSKVGLAKSNMSNVETYTLASGREDKQNGNLAYADTSNVNTKYLTDNIKHNGENGNKPLSYNNFENSDSTLLTTEIKDRPITMSGPVLAKNDLSNVNNDILSSLFFDQSKGFNLETTTNKDNTISKDIVPELNHYPTSSAVKNYVNNTLDEIYTKISLPQVETFTGNNTPNQVLQLKYSLDFLLFICGILQSKDAFLYDHAKKTITIPWAVEDTTPQNILVYYLGYER